MIPYGKGKDKPSHPFLTHPIVSMYNFYWGDCVKNWKQLFAVHYADFEERDIDQLTKELTEYNGPARRSVFFLYRFRSPTSESSTTGEECDHAEVEEEEGVDIEAKVENWTSSFQQLWASG